MNRKRVARGAGWWIVAGAAMWSTPYLALSQNPFTAPPAAMDTLNSAPTTTGAGYVSNQTLTNLTTPGAPAPRQGGPSGARRNRGGGGTSLQVPAGVTAAQGQAVQAVQQIITPKFKALVGTRVFDNITGELLDDARVIYIEEADKANYFDDGTHGDAVPDDGVYTKVDRRNDVLGQSNQRVKEQLIQALNKAEELDPVEFFGYTMMTTDRNQAPPRNHQWRIVPDEKRGIGYHLAEAETQNPIEVPKYQIKEQDKDTRIAGNDGWAIKFLDEYRITKGDAQAPFYPMYIPHPPLPPNVAPPTVAGWVPFPMSGQAANPPPPPRPQGGSGGGRGRSGGGGGSGSGSGSGSGRR